MFRRLLANNIKNFGVKKYSNTCYYNNEDIVRLLEKINTNLTMLMFNSSIINISLSLILLTN
jgi:hypothetical protein